MRTVQRRPQAMMTSEPCAVEPLEPRRVLAGDVAVTFGEVLEIRGDRSGNKISITQDNTGQVVIVTHDSTTVNGEEMLSFDGLELQSIDIRLFGGNDRLEITGLSADLDVRIETGFGADRLLLDDVTTGGDITIEMNSGHDKVEASDLQAAEDLSIDTGSGSSSVILTESDVGGFLTFTGGDNVDHVTFEDVHADEDLDMDLGAGNDRVDLYQFSAKNILVDMGLGNDYCKAINVDAEIDATFLGGDGHDMFDNRRQVDAGGTRTIQGFNKFV